MKGPDVAVVVPTLRGGGAQRVAVTLVGALAARGLDVELVLFRAVGPFLAEVPAGTPVVDLGARRALLAVPGLIRYLRARRPATVLASMTQTIFAVVLSVRLARVDVRVVGQVHNTMSKATAASGLADRILDVLVRFAYRRCDAVVTVSAGVRDDLVRSGVPVELVHVLFNPIPVDDIARAAAASPPHPWFSDGGPPVVVGAGRLTAQKDHATLIRAVARARERAPCRLVILGEGEERPAFERLVRDEGLDGVVDLPGFVDAPEPYLGHAALFVLSSAWEGLPTVLLEALAAGTPVVATDCESGPREILAGGSHGRLVPVGDPDAMAAAIVEALGQEHDRDALRRRAHDFSPEALTDDYLRVLGR